MHEVLGLFSLKFMNNFFLQYIENKSRNKPLCQAVDSVVQLALNLQKA